MRFGAVFALLLLTPSVAWGATELELSKSATMGGKTFPLQAVVTATTSEAILSDEKIEGAVPVTITFYIAPKPKPKPQATSSQAAAAIQSSQGIQDGITGVSPAVGGAVEPFFTLVDGGRQKAADTLDSQLQGVKSDLGSDAGNILGAEDQRRRLQPHGDVLVHPQNPLYICIDHPALPNQQRGRILPTHCDSIPLLVVAGL
jgi:hypothetical protein